MLQCNSIHLRCNIPHGIPAPEHFDIVSSQVAAALSEEQRAQGCVLVQAKVFSADPYLRGVMKTHPVGSVISGFIAGIVLQSGNDAWRDGDLFGCSAAFSTVQVIQPSQTVMWRLTDFITVDQISWGVGVLGMPGATAYGGLVDVLEVKSGETLFVSAAGGAVGRCANVRALGFDAAIDYTQFTESANAEAEFRSKLKEHAPDGIDMYFENVGGFQFQAAFNSLRKHGRIAVCGSISNYNSDNTVVPPTVSINHMQMIYSFQSIKGFMCMPWLSGQKGAFLRDMHAWLRDGKVRVVECFFEGVEQWPAAFASLFTGANDGKVVVRV